MTRTAISLAVAVLTALVFAVLPRAGHDETPRAAAEASEVPERVRSPAATAFRTFQSARREAVALAEDGRLAEAIVVGTRALRIGEKSFGEDRSVTREALDGLANAIERWYVELR